MMSRRIWTLAQNTFREGVRNKIFYLMVFFGAAFGVLAKLLALLSVGERDRILMDSGLAGVSFFAVVVTVFSGINLIFKEIERKTVYNLLSKPLRRWEFILGKYLGLLLIMFVALLLMGIPLFLFLRLFTGGWNLVLLWHFPFLFMELSILTAVSILFSTFSSPTVSSLFSLSFYLVAHVTWTYNTFRHLIPTTELKILGAFLYYLLPNLEKFNIQQQLVMGTPPGLWQTALAMAYGLCYTGAILLLSIHLFRKRQFQ